jgi:hypothetical protein
MDLIGSIDGKASSIIVVNMNGESELLMYAETVFSTVNNDVKSTLLGQCRAPLSFTLINSVYDSSTRVEVSLDMQV